MYFSVEQFEEKVPGNVGKVGPGHWLIFAHFAHMSETLRASGDFILDSLLLLLIFLL